MKYYTTRLDLSITDIDSLFEEFNKSGQLQSYPFPGEEYKDRCFAGVRRSKTCFITPTTNPSLHDLIFDKAIEIANDRFSENDLFDLVLQFTEYDETYKGHYNWHADAPIASDTDHAPIRERGRVLSFSVLLNNFSEYSGGNFEFKDFEFEGLKNKFDMVMFYSDLEHRVTPVTKGTRYSLVGWLSGVKKNNG